MRRPPAFRSRPRPAAGFTLAELLVAATLLTLVMTAVYTLFHASIRTWRGVEQGFDAHMEARNAMTLFSHEYGNIMGRAGHLFEGDEDSVTMFVVAQPMDLEQGEGRRLMRVVYSYDRNRRALEREEALVETALPKQPPQDRELDRSRIKLGREFKREVASEVSQFSVRYVWIPLPDEPPPADQPPPVEPPVYQDRHQERWGLPQAVEITLELRDPEDPEKKYTLSSLFPMRAPNYRRSRRDLEEMFGA